MANTINWLLDKSEQLNIADDVDREDLEALGQRVVNGYEDDEASRAEWLAETNEFIDTAKQVAKEKSYPWKHAANIKYPTLAIAALQFQARAYPSIVPSRDIVKGKVTGYDPDGSKTAKAERIGKHMTYQLTEEMEEWEEDMDKALLVLPIVGCVFKKTFFDPLKNRNVSKAVWAKDLVIDYNAASLERAPRKSESFELYPGEIEERFRAGIWTKFDIEYEDEENDEPEEFIEQHTSYDLDGDGYKEPYVVTVHQKTGEVVRIVPRYDEDSIYFKDEDDKIKSVGEKKREVSRKNATIQQQNMQAAMIAEAALQATGGYHKPPTVPTIPEPQFDNREVAKIEPIEYYTTYTFLPNPDGSIYAMGFGHLLGSLSDAANTTINQMLDAATLSNLSGGFIAQSAKRPAGPIQGGVGEFVSIDTRGMSLRDSIMPFNAKGPSAQSFSLLDLLLTAARDITGIKDIAAEVGSSAQATTAMIIQEESTKVYSSLYKRIFRSAKKEFKKLYRLNRKYLPDETYFRVLDTEAAIKREDYQNDELDVQPVGDPTVASSSQRLLKYQAALQVAMAGNTGEDLWVLKRRLYDAMDIPNIDEFMKPPSNEPDPMMQAELQKMDDEHQKKMAEIKEIMAKAMKTLADAENVEVGTQIDKYLAQVNALTGGGNAADQGGVSGMEAASNNAMVPQGAGGLPAAATELVGAGGNAETQQPL